MRFFPAEPDIATIFNRIVHEDIDLQPDFQRGEVWPVSKQQRLIDSILRGWIVPPILLVAGKKGGVQQVLDGQQRLASIRDFKLNKFSIDGVIEPSDPFIRSLHGLRFHSLPPEVAKAFDRTTLRMYEIAEHLPAEPAEIFFRLNQPTTLTAAEKRNAFFGPVRDQIRELVEIFEGSPLGKTVLGFSNSRMAYDDVLARFACMIEQGTLRKKITAAAVNEMYRRPNPLSDVVLLRVSNALHLTVKIMSLSLNTMSFEPKLNKATFFSWLLFFSRLDATGDAERLASFFSHFELVRSGYTSDGKVPHSMLNSRLNNRGSILASLLMVYTDRATARVADVSSVVLRDFVLWASWFEFSGGKSAGCFDQAYARIPDFYRFASSATANYLDSELTKFVDDIQWGVEV